MNSAPMAANVREECQCESQQDPTRRFGHGEAGISQGCGCSVDRAFPKSEIENIHEVVDNHIAIQASCRGHGKKVVTDNIEVVDVDNSIAVRVAGQKLFRAEDVDFGVSGVGILNYQEIDLDVRHACCQIGERVFRESDAMGDRIRNNTLFLAGTVVERRQ